MKRIVKMMMVLLVCFTQLMPIRSADKQGIIGNIEQSMFGVDDAPSGAIYGQAQMQYEFLLDNGSQRIGMGGNNLRGIAYLNTAQGSVYCIDPTTGACGSVGNDPADSYTVEPYENEFADKMGLIWYYGNQQHAHDRNFMDYVAVTQLMIWELYGWYAELYSGFENYQQIRDEIDDMLSKHGKKPMWTVTDITVNQNNYPEDQRSDEAKINLRLEDTPSFTLKPFDSITFEDTNGVFETYYTDWTTIPSNIRTERIGKNGIKFTALGSFEASALGYTKVDPQVIGHAYLLKPKTNNKCQQLVQPYVSEKNSGRVQFLITSDGSTPDHGEAVTYPDFVKADAENQNITLENSLYQLFSSQTLKVPFVRRTMTCRVNADDEVSCSEERISQHQESIYNTNELITEMMTDSQGHLDLSILGSMFEAAVQNKTYNKSTANGGYDIYEPADDYVGFTGGKFHLIEAVAYGIEGSYTGYYNDRKKISFVIDANADQRMITALNFRQKAKIVLHKADAEDTYLNHNNPLLPQGDASFANAVFTLHAKEDICLKDGTIIYSKGELVDTIVCNEQGIGESKELELGKYSLMETELPEGYWYYDYESVPQEVVLDIRYTGQDHSLQIYTYDADDLGDTSPFEAIDIHVMNGNEPTSSLIYRNSVQKGHLMITKFYEGDAGNESAGMPSGKQPAEDIYFGIYLDSKAINNLSADLDEAFFMSKQLDGTYISNKVQAEAIAKDHQLALCDVYMVIKTNAEGEASTKMPETIVYASTNGTMQNDTVFTKPLPLPYGKYTALELNTPQGYEPISFQFEVEKVSGVQAEDRLNKFAITSERRLLENQPSKQKITITKRDIETGDLIDSDDTIFKIWQWNYDEIFEENQIRTWWDEQQQTWHIALVKPQNQGISGSNVQVWLDESCGHWIYQRMDTTSGMEILEQYSTIDGSLQLPQPLSVGRYMLCEIKSPKGYQLSAQPLSFEVETPKHAVDADDSGYVMVPKYDKEGQLVKDKDGNVIKVPVPNLIHLFVDMENQPQKGRIMIEKSGSQLLGFVREDTMFKPYWEIAKLPYGAVFEVRAAEDVLVNNQLIYEADEHVETIISDIYGNATTHDLPLGTYNVCEIEASDGYLTNQECFTVKLTADSAIKRIFPQFLSIENKRQRAEYSFLKYFQNQTGLKLADGVTFGLYANEELSVKEYEKQPSLYDTIPVNMNELLYRQCDDGIIIDGYVGHESRIEIPNQIDGVLVVEIAAEAFSMHQLESVIIPKSVKRIGSRAFADNELRMVYLQPESVTVESADIFENNTMLETIEVDKLQPYDQIKIGYGFMGVFDELDGRCMGYALRIHDSSDDIKDDFTNEPEIAEMIPLIELDPSQIELSLIEFMGNEYNVISNVNSDALGILLPEAIDGIHIDGILSLGAAEVEAVAIPDSYQYFGETAFKGQQKLKSIQFIVSAQPVRSLIIHESSFDNTPKLALIYAESSSVAAIRDQLLVQVNGELKSMAEIDEIELPVFCLLPIQISEHRNEGGIDDAFTLPDYEEILSKDFTSSIPKHTLIEIVEVKKGKGVISSELPPGKYYLKEQSTSSGYILDETIYEFEVEEDDGGEINLFDQPLINVSENAPYIPTPSSNKHHVELILYKAFEIDSKENASQLTAEFEIVDQNGRQIDTFISDQDGVGVWKGSLEKGSYAVREIKSATGYMVDERYFGFDVLGKANEVILINEGEAVVNRLIRYKLVIHKTDNNDLPLAGAEFSLYDENFEFIKQAESDDKGYISFEALKSGVYYLKETKAPEGYILDDALRKIELFEDTALQLSNQKGENMRVYPETGVMAKSKDAEEVLSAIVLASVLLLIIIGYKRYKNTI